MSRNGAVRDRAGLRALWLATDWRDPQARRRFVRERMKALGGTPVGDLPPDHAARRHLDSGCWSRKHGPAHWGLLHRRALLPVADAAAELAWLKGEYAAGIGCEHCRAHWLNLVAVLPPEFERYFWWSWRVHDIVSEQIRKPPEYRMSFEDALAKWQMM